MAEHLNDPHFGNQTRTAASMYKLDRVLLLSQKKWKFVSFIHSFIFFDC